MADENNTALARFENLQPGKYTFMAWHNNATSHNNIFEDVQLYMNDGGKVRINNIGINVIHNNFQEYQYWTSPLAYVNFSGWENMKGIFNENISPQYYNVNYPQGNDNNQSIWLSDAYNSLNLDEDYPSLMQGEYMFIIFEFEILEGEAVLNHVAYKSGNKNFVQVGSNSSPIEVIERDAYAIKGIADAADEIEADIEYTITDNENYIPVRVFNLKHPLGYTTSFWETNVNPQQDYSPVGIDGFPNEYVTDIATESELLKYTYYDENKINKYNLTMEQEELIVKSPIWYFDEFHKGLLPDNEIQVGYVPNVVSQGIDYQNEVSYANYSVVETYNVKIKNESSQPKKVEFHVDSLSQIFVKHEKIKSTFEDTSQSNNTEQIEVDPANADIRDGGFLKKNGDDMYGDPEHSVDQNMVYFIVPNDGEFVNYKISVILVTAEKGSVRNYFKITDVN